MGVIGLIFMLIGTANLVWFLFWRLVAVWGGTSVRLSKRGGSQDDADRSTGIAARRLGKGASRKMLMSACLLVVGFVLFYTSSV